MALVKKNLDYLKDTAFGNMSDIFSHDRMFDFMVRPIGLRNKSYAYMMEHLYRNIGNATFEYDGFGTPIGEMSNPFYNTITEVPWFLSDDYKNSASNYIQYIKNVYGSTLSVENINSSNTFTISYDAAEVGTMDLINYYKDLTIDGNASYLSLNPNGIYSDTHLGDVNKYFVYDTLRNSVKTNDRKNTQKYSITESLPDYFGLKTISLINNKIADISDKIDDETGRLIDGAVSPLVFVDGPIYSSNYGHISDMGSYSDFYKSLGYKTKEFYDKSVRNRRYYPGLRGSTNGKTYIGKAFRGIGHETLKYTPYPSSLEDMLSATAIDESQIRYIFETYEEHSNISSHEGGVYVYAEDEYGSHPSIINQSFNPGTSFGTYTSYGENFTTEDLLKKTNDSFQNDKYKTIIARFHTDVQEGTDATQTAISKRYGMSHGRNLLKVTPDKSQGYDNPYCRVWTYHHQYHRIKDAIRPFEQSQDELYYSYNFSTFSADRTDYGFDNGRSRLARYGTLNKDNGLVNITPIDNGDASKKVDIKNCMFSIENLAWKDMFSTDLSSRNTYQTNGLSPEQKGPFGGRIMWFPPYDLKFNEDVTVRWNENSFIGRGENIYTYTNTNRVGNLSFKLLIDHPSIINFWENRGKSTSDSVDSIDDPEQQLLRFFAGCDMLTATPAPVEEDAQILQNEENEVPAPNSEYLSFFVFYPNNYSGVYDKDVNFVVRYLANGVGAGKERNSGNPNTVNYNVPFSKISNIDYGGYEIRPGKPISLDTEAQEHNSLRIGRVKYNGGDKYHELYAQEGESTDIWWQRKWFYRVDDDLSNELLAKENYLDSKSFGLNSSKGFDAVTEFFKVKDEQKDNTFSFADVFVALGGKDEETVLSGFYNKSKAIRFSELIRQYGVEKVECIGRASTQGKVPSNNRLQERRASTMRKWLIEKNICDPEKITVVTGGTGGNAVGNTGNINDKENKLWRNTEIRIYLNKDASVVSQNVLKETFNSPTSDSTLGKNILTGNNSQNTSNAFRYVVNDLGKNIQYSNISFNKVESTEDYLKKSFPINLNIPTGIVSSKSIEELNGLIDDVFGEKDSIQSGAQTAQKRYDNEAKFFTLLEKEEPFLHKKISDKIKYFDPAFHSVSPEGFNARLTFLQQCTRQGPTVGNSDNHSANNTANNLSFGRPPVCILRIGDFYYTKILIESLTISYDPLLWDLNTEGIGVMPMIADINIRFIFIGGSSLAGHISRLQNALSFNYYANTEVYDDRAELAKYNDAGEIVDFAPFNPRK